MRLLPSQVITGIRGLASGFPGSLGGVWPTGAPPKLDGYLSDPQIESIARIGAFIDALPSEILQLCSDPTPIIVARASIRNFLDQPPPKPGFEGRKIPGSVIVDLYEAISTLPDRAAPASANELLFITAPALRASIRDDLGSVETSMRDADWKAATVMAGSAAEALLLWAVQEEESKGVSLTTARAAVAAATSGSAPPADLSQWNLHQLTEGALSLGLIESTTAAQLRIAKGFRNLIHPGRVQRTQERCDRGTSLAAAAATEFVIRDLTP